MTTHSIPCPGWGRGSGSSNLYQVHLEILNQSVCEQLYPETRNWDPIFDQDHMICTGDFENGGRGVCPVGHNKSFRNVNGIQKMKLRMKFLLPVCVCLT